MCSWGSGSFPYFLLWLCSSFFAFTISTKKAACFTPSAAALLQMQRSADFGLSVLVQLCAQQNSNLQEKMTKNYRKSVRYVLHWLCWAGIATWQSVGAWVTAWDILQAGTCRSSCQGFLLLCVKVIHPSVGNMPENNDVHG